MLDWDTFTKEVKDLGNKIDYQPDLIVGIARGGVIPAVFLSKQLKVKDMMVLKVRVEGNERILRAEVVADVKDKNILLVEDMLETGKTLVVVKEYLESKGANVKTACLYIMPITEVKPDYFLTQINQVEKFPWE